MIFKKPKSKILISKPKMSDSQIFNYKHTLYKTEIYGPNFIKNLKLRLENGRKIILGKGNRGTVYLGSLKFQDGTEHRVAIKVFKAKFSQEYGKFDVMRRYQEVISEFYNLKIPKGLLGNEREISFIPKCFLVRLENGEYIFVSEAFTKGNKGKQESKFAPKSEIPVLQDLNYNKQILYSGAIITSKGYVMTNDVFMRFKGSKDFIFLDFDGLAANQKYKEEHRAQAYINNIFLNVLDVIKDPNSRSQLLSFVEQFIKEDKGNLGNSFKHEVLDRIKKINL